MSNPRVGIISLGGTISSVSRSPSDESEQRVGVVPKLGADQLVEDLGLDDPSFDVEAVTFRQTASGSLSFDDVVALLREIERMVADGMNGIVVTQGTDTMDEIPFIIDLVYAGDVPVVFTGAMRAASIAGSDGSANILAAIKTAISDQALGSGVLVVMNDTIHASRWVSKRSTSNPGAFTSMNVGPIGWISEGSPHLALKRVNRTTLNIPNLEKISSIRVAVASINLADDGRMLAALPDLGYHGAVIQAMGGGHVPGQIMPQVRQLVAKMPVVLASRVGEGSILSKTYGFDGSEVDLADAGTISAGSLDPYKARLLLTLLLARDGSNSKTLRSDFEAIARIG